MQLTWGNKELNKKHNVSVSTISSEPFPGWWLNQPTELKNISQNGFHLPQIGMKIPKNS